MNSKRTVFGNRHRKRRSAHVQRQFAEHEMRGMLRMWGVSFTWVHGVRLFDMEPGSICWAPHDAVMIREDGTHFLRTSDMSWGTYSPDTSVLAYHETGDRWHAISFRVRDTPEPLTHSQHMSSRQCRSYTTKLNSLTPSPYEYVNRSGGQHGPARRLTLLAFTDRYNHTARPFNWKFTAADLATLLQQISARQEPADLPKAA